MEVFKPIVNIQEKVLIWEQKLKVWLIQNGYANTISYLLQNIEGKLFLHNCAKILEKY